MPKFDPKNTAVTFDDVLLKPGYSTVLPPDVDVRTQFTRHIKLDIPIVSAAMDTVTEAALAIALAQEGGIGVIHRNMPAEAQAAEVNKVKRYVSGMIVEPYTLAPDSPVADALAIMAGYKKSGVPVVDAEGVLLGIITNRDLRFEKRRDIPVAELMTREGLITARVGTSLETAKALLHQYRIEKLPIVDGKGHLKGLITVKDIMKALEYPHATKDEQGRLCVAAAVGVSERVLERVEKLVQKVRGARRARRPRRKTLSPEIIGRGPEMEEVFALVSVASGSRATVLLSGETGTGKELIARAIHQESGRRKDSFVAVNCAAFPDTLLESELFGHVRGSFTKGDR